MRGQEGVPQIRRIGFPPKSFMFRNRAAEEIDGRLPAQNSVHNRFVEIGVRERADLHDGGAVCNSSRARMSFWGRSAVKGSDWRAPSAHFSFWRIR